MTLKLIERYQQQNKTTVQVQNKTTSTPRTRPENKSKNSVKLTKAPTDINSDFNLKDYLELKRREREGRIFVDKSTANRIEMLPSPISNVSVGIKDEVTRQEIAVTRSNAAVMQQIEYGKEKICNG